MNMDDKYELEQRLYQKMMEEKDLYFRSVRAGSADEVLKETDRMIAYDEIIPLFKPKTFFDREIILTLLSMDYPLSEIYDEFEIDITGKTELVTDAVLVAIDFLMKLHRG